MSALKKYHYEKFAETLKTTRHNLVEDILTQLTQRDDVAAESLRENYQQSANQHADNQFIDDLVSSGFSEFGDEVRQLCAVRKAEQRIEQGRYGICVNCNREISLDRLDIQPAAALCAVCERSQNTHTS